MVRWSWAEITSHLMLELLGNLGLRLVEDNELAILPIKEGQVDSG